MVSPLEACDSLFAVYSIRTLLLEGGPTLNQAFLRESLADELFLTISLELRQPILPSGRAVR